MFYVSSTFNNDQGLANMMDIPGIVMWDDNTPMVATAEGKKIAYHLNDFLSDRPFHVDQLAGNWYVEAMLAQNAAGTRADPIIVRDGDRGRLIPMFQAADQNDPKGAVAAEVIAWLMDTKLVPSKLAITQYGLGGRDRDPREAHGPTVGRLGDLHPLRDGRGGQPDEQLRDRRLRHRLGRELRRVRDLDRHPGRPGRDADLLP